MSEQITPSLQAVPKGHLSDETLQEIIRRIVEVVAPEKIILFGSAARGEMGPDSDVDLLVVKSQVHRRHTAQKIETSLVGIGIPTDIIVATPEDLERHQQTIGWIYRPALQEGKVIYAACTPGPNRVKPTGHGGKKRATKRQ